MPWQSAGQVELEQHDMHLPRRHAGGADQLVDIDRAWTKCRDDQLAFALANVGQRLGDAMLVAGGSRDRRRGRGPAEDWREGFQNVARRGDEAGTLLQEIVGPRRPRIERAAGNGEDLTPLFAGEAGGDQRARASAASITTTPSEIPEISRLRRGKS